MFPSSGLFGDINCPFTKRGVCERPHCFYKHAEMRDMFGSSFKSSIVDFTGVQDGYPYDVSGAPINDQKDDCLQQLAKINKEIESVRHEVEQEQRRLTHYQTVQVDSRNSVPSVSVSKYETTGKNIDKGPYCLSSCTNLRKTNSRARKYVVDNSKPRTDLEYDPLSNFSANLRPYSSSEKEQKEKDGKGLKRGRNACHSDRKQTLNYQAPLSRSPSPDRHDDSYEDSELIIDIPPLPDGETGKSENSVSEKSLEDIVEEFQEVKAPLILLDSPPLQVSKIEAFDAASKPALKLKDRVHINCVTENKINTEKILSHSYENKECENVLVNGSGFDLTKCLDVLERESRKNTHFHSTETLVDKSPEPADPPATTDKQDQNQNKLVVIKNKVPQCEPSHSVENMNPLQPYNYHSKNSLFYQAPEIYSEEQNRHHASQAQTTEPLAQNRVSDHWASANILPTLRPRSQKTSNKTLGLMQGKTLDDHPPLERYVDPVQPASGSSSAQAGHISSESIEQPSMTADGEEVIIIDSCSDNEDELNYSEIELSDDDPMEECYRIFMEANEDNGSEEHPDVSVRDMDVDKPMLNVKPPALAGKKRVAHEAKHVEPAAKSRPQPQVLVPLRGPVVSGFAPQPSITAKIQQVQQRASILTASLKGGQAFVSSACQRTSETQSTPSPSTQTPENLQSAPVQNAYINYIPLGTAMINVGNNLQLILPEGAFPLPVTSSSSQVTSVLTPITQVYTNPVTVKHTYLPPGLNHVHRYSTTAPMLIPAQARKPTFNSAFALAHSSPAASAPKAAVHSTVKPVPTKRKLKQQCGAPKDKVPHDIRQRYVNMFTEEFLKTSANVNDAFEKALAEEKTLYNRSVNKIKYLSVAVNALKRLKNQSAAAAKDPTVVSTQRCKGNIPLTVEKFEGNDDMPFYESLKDYLMMEDKMIESNYPVHHPEKPGCAVLFADPKKVNTDPLKRICCRCGATYSVSETGKHVRKEECNYHYGKGVKNKVPGGVETRYSCCEGVMGAPGCQVFKLHVHDSLSLDGFVTTIPRKSSDRSCPGVYSLDCEMCYTIHGLELSRVTVVNSSLEVIYDTFVRPDNEVIDYNTRFSGISENDVTGNHTSLREVQEALLSFIKADTILIGHGMETDLCALKLHHGTVVDTSVVFPHRLGPPHKLTLNNLTAEHLRRIIQQSVYGHDTAEDAAACMELMLWKVKEDGKLKK
ncbi:RNA exonuclease 1 homolog isoform X2 [Labrus mixtus]|uniref:RNA exonuclease 1 homolog isoform X2 n=1 Tax=Labrus mixtus TaxID=508554 RepID=UPI0029C0930E|nr:RNA exonuclease 1 homolog isoform X2 [Labrus mixtus]